MSKGGLTMLINVSSSPKDLNRKEHVNRLKFLLIGTTLTLTLAMAGCSASGPVVEPEVLTNGKELYIQHCASCHGANLEGQPDWQVPNADGILPAPPHNREGHTSHHPDAQLLQIIAEGGITLNSAMPAFSETLSEEEMKAILAYIKSFW